MADENIVTNIVANADFSGLIADVNKVTASLSKLQAQIIASDAKLANQVSVMNRSFGENLRRTGQFATHFVTLTSDVEKFGKNLDSGQLKLKNYFQTFQQHTKTQGGLIRELAKQQVALQNAIVQPLGKNAQGLMQYSVHIPQGLDAVKNKTALARQELQIMNKVIQDGGVQLINWGKNTQWAGRQLTVGLTVPLAAFGMAAAKSFREADAELTRLTKVYGGVAATSSADLTKIRNEVSATAKELAKAYGTSFKETIQLAADVAATGKTGNDLLGSVKETTRLAVLGEVDRQDAMKATLAIQNAFKQNTEQLTESINFLNSVENQTSTSLADLIEAIPKAGPVVQGLGGSVKDLALYLTAMKEGGINASEGANALKSALASLINPTKVAQESFGAMGISLKNIVNDNAGDLTGMILELQSALDSLNPLQKQQAIEQLFGKFQFARMNALFENLGRQGSQTLQVMDLMKTSSQDLANVASRELSLVTESASGKYKRAVESLKADLAGIGEEFLKVQTFFVNVVDSIVKFVSKLPAPVKTILTLVTGLTAIIGPVIMLTGVLANFFGYIIKGASHFRSLFKGGEGWKMLTPEILAASKAGSLAEATFYNDAKAATVLKTAIQGLIAEFTILEQKAKSGQISVSPAFTTMGGTIVAAGGRQVNPNHPLLSPQDTRSMSHMNPVAGMTTDQRSAQTIFGVVPGAPKVNQKIGNNPQIYAEGDLPKIPGLTSIGGASTGVVAQEAAKWHAMTGALAMQSDTEIKLLKQEVSRTGLITNELSASYQALLPSMTSLIKNAATESSAIVAQLQAGKITVDQARVKIIALNAQVEKMIAGAAVDIAGQQGRSINLTSVPLLNQPVVNNAGKSNMKELSRPGRTRNLLNQIAQGLGVKTFGAPYSTETTIPKRMATGGTVPGSGNTDTVPAMLTPGEFVINKEATAANLPLLQEINGQGSNGPMYNLGSSGPVKEGWDVKTSGLSGQEVLKVLPGFTGDLSRVYSLKGTAGLYIGDITDPAILEEFGTPKQKKAGKITRQSLNLKMKNGSIPGRLLAAAMKSSGSIHRGSTEQFLSSLASNGIISKVEAEQTSKLIYDKYLEVLNRQGTSVGDANNDYWKLANNRIKSTVGNNPEVAHLWDQFSQNVGAHTGDTTSKASKSGASTSALAQTLTTTDGKKIKVGTLEGSGGALFAHAKSPEPFMSRLAKSGLGKWVFAAGLSRGRGASGPLAALPRRANRGGRIGFNSGGMVPGYMSGGQVKGYRMGGMVAQMGLGMLGSMGGQSLGQSIGGDMGGSLGGMAGFMLPGMLMGGRGGSELDISSKLEKSVFANNKLGQSLAGTVFQGGKLKSTLAQVALGLTKFNLVTGVAVGVAAGLYTAYKKNQEQLKLNALGFGLTAESAGKAGLKYVDYNQKIKDSIQKSKDLMEANKLAYESMTQAGIPIKMTITEYGKLKEEVKNVYSEQIKLINSTKKAELGDVAVRLKTQLMAAGMTAEESTKKIYAMLSLSKNSGLAAASTVGNKDFNAITDAKTAAGGSLKSFDTAVRLGEAQSQASALNTSLTAIDAGVDEIVRKSEEAARKDKSNKTEAISRLDAEIQMMDYLNTSKYKQVTLTKQAISEMAKSNPAIKELANNTDTVLSIFQKLRLQAAGLSGDLSTLNAAQAQALYNLSNVISKQVIANNKSSNGLLSDEYSKLKTLESQRAAAARSMAGQSVKSQIDSKQRLKDLQSQIDATNKLADSRIKALDASKAEADLNREMQSAKLELQFAESTGNTQQAAQARLRYQSALESIQTEGQKKSIQAAADKANAAPLAEIKKINDANEKISNAAALAADSITVFDKKIAALTLTIDNLNTAQAAYELNLQKYLADNPGKTRADYQKTSEGREAAAGLVAPTIAAGGKVAKANAGYPGKNGWVDAVTPGGSAADFAAKAFTVTNFYINNKSLEEYLKATGMGAMGSTPTSIPKSSAAGSYGGGTYVSLSQLEQSGAKKKFSGPGDRTGSYVGSSFTDPKGQKWVVTADAGYAGFAVKKAGYGMKDIDPRIPTIVGDRGPELIFGNMVIPNLADVPYASPSYNVPSAAKQLSSVGTNSGNSSVVVNQSFYQAPGENTDAFMRKVTQATVAAIGKDAKINRSQIGESRSI
jgi:TP901 family phage tail tape measure protein